jgi:hypothetical protein
MITRLLNAIMGLLNTILVIAILCVIGLGLFVWLYGRGFSGPNRDIKSPQCDIHAANRISFHGPNKGLDLNRMLDSFKNINIRYRLPDSALMESTRDCECCCIYDDRELFFDESPKEIYWITTERHIYNSGFEGQYTDDIGYIDIVSTFNHGNWHCSLTSKLDSSEKRRIRNRMKSEILFRLPIIKDTSSHKDEL